MSGNAPIFSVACVIGRPSDRGSADYSVATAAVGRSLAASQKACNIKLNNKVSVAIASEDQNFYKLRGLSMSGIATRVIEERRAEELSLRFFRAFPHSKRLVPEDPKQLAPRGPCAPPRTRPIAN